MTTMKAQKIPRSVRPSVRPSCESILSAAAVAVFCSDGGGGGGCSEIGNSSCTWSGQGESVLGD